jgi:hypothetical protein
MCYNRMVMSLFWKIYFWFYLVYGGVGVSLILFGLTSQEVNNRILFDIFSYIFNTIALYSFAYKKDIFKKAYIWGLILTFQIVSIIYYYIPGLNSGVIVWFVIFEVPVMYVLLKLTTSTFIHSKTKSKGGS